MQINNRTITINSIPQAFKKLDAFVGQWNLEGEPYEGAGLPGHAAWITTLEYCEELENELCLVHRIKGDAEEHAIAYIEVIAHDEKNKIYTIRSFYSDGKTYEWQSREKNGIWTLTGYTEAKGKLLQVRSTTIFSTCGNAMAIEWEQLNTDGEWETFWNVKANKVMQAA
jgi:hypothetical protein